MPSPADTAPDTAPGAACDREEIKRLLDGLAFEAGFALPSPEDDLEGALVGAGERALLAETRELDWPPGVDYLWVSATDTAGAPIASMRMAVAHPVVAHPEDLMIGLDGEGADEGVLASLLWAGRERIEMTEDWFADDGDTDAAPVGLVLSYHLATQWQGRGVASAVAARMLVAVSEFMSAPYGQGGSSTAGDIEADIEADEGKDAGKDGVTDAGLRAYPVGRFALLASPIPRDESGPTGLSDEAKVPVAAAIAAMWERAGLETVLVHPTEGHLMLGLLDEIAATVVTAPAA